MADAFAFQIVAPVRLVQRHHHGVGPAGGHHDAVAVDEGRLGEFPVRHDLAAEVARQVLAPALLAGRRLEAHQVALGAQAVDQRAVDGRRRARPRVAVLPDRPDLGLPELLAVGRGQGDDVLAALQVPHREEAVAADRQARISRPETGHLPGQSGAVGVPLLQQVGIGRLAVAVGPPELGPVAGGGSPLLCGEPWTGQAEAGRQHGGRGDETSSFEGDVHADRSRAEYSRRRTAVSSRSPQGDYHRRPPVAQGAAAMSGPSTLPRCSRVVDREPRCCC